MMSLAPSSRRPAYPAPVMASARWTLPDVSAGSNRPSALRSGALRLPRVWWAVTVVSRITAGAQIWQPCTAGQFPVVFRKEVHDHVTYLSKNVANVAHAHKPPEQLLASSGCSVR